MSYRDTIVQMNDYRKKIAGMKARIRDLQAGIDPEPVADYAFSTCAGPVRLSALFGDRNELFMIHNMGKSCPHCTMWADGLNGVQQHLRDRAALVVSSPDSPQIQRDFAASRGWRFPMVSHAGTSFAAEMGYCEDGRAMPGVSVFRRQENGIFRISDTGFGPDDDFCVVWSFLNMLPDSPAGWKPRYTYA